jgi:uncharacterized protein with NRDE domain
VFIDEPHYATRCSTVLVRERTSGRLAVVELTHGPKPFRTRIELPRWPAASASAAVVTEGVCAAR